MHVTTESLTLSPQDDFHQDKKQSLMMSSSKKSSGRKVKTPSSRQFLSSNTKNKIQVSAPAFLLRKGISRGLRPLELDSDRLVKHGP
jgi:hypothetical protein